jgi:hypothetical protein
MAAMVESAKPSATALTKRDFMGIPLLVRPNE